MANLIDVREEMEKREPLLTMELKNDNKIFIGKELSESPSFSADDAFARLEYVRNMRKDFKQFFNEHNGLMSDKSQRAYDSLYEILLKFDDLELHNIKYGM